MSPDAAPSAQAARFAANGHAILPAGGAMLMKPLLLHASGRSTSARPRRVVHLEFSATELPAGLAWHERRAV